MNPLRPLAACRQSPAGAGHFVKMVHNGIERGLTQEEILSAKRLGFGGHIESQESIDPEPTREESQGQTTVQEAAG